MPKSNPTAASIYTGGVAILRQVSSKQWARVIASKGSQQEQDDFIRLVNNFKTDWGNRKRALTAQYKADLSNPVYLAAKAVLQAELESTLLGYGFYETVTDETLNTEFHDMIMAVVHEKPALVLRVVTSITNYYRSQQGKSSLTGNQVKTRLLA